MLAEAHIGSINLPGPFRWAREVARDAGDGVSSLLMVPDWFADTTSGEGVLDLVAEAAEAEDLEPTERDVVDAIVARIGDDGSWDPGFDRIRSLVGWPLLRARRFLIRGWEFDISGFAPRLEAQLHDLGDGVSEPPVFIIVCRLSDLGNLDAQALDGLHQRVRWWWAVLGRLDTESVVSICGLKLGGVEQAFVAELTGWDLDAAAEMSANWDGSIDSLPTLESLLPAPPEPVDRAATRRRFGSGSPQPSPELRARWAAGDVDEWERRTRGRFAVPDPARANSYLWRAQSRLLFSALDTHRRDFEAKVRAKGPPWLIERIDLQAQGGPVELASLKWQLSGTRVLTSQEWDYLGFCVDVRNRLAHLQTISPAEVRRLLGEH